MTWRIFLASYQHGDRPSEIKLGSRVTWPLVLDPDFPVGWPTSMLTTAPLRLETLPEDRDETAPAALVAVNGGLRARWTGRGEPGLETTTTGLLSVDYLTPPLVLSTGTVTELSVLSQVLEAGPSGRLVPGWREWSTRLVETVPASFDGGPLAVGTTLETGVIALVDIED